MWLEVKILVSEMILRVDGGEGGATEGEMWGKWRNIKSRKKMTNDRRENYYLKVNLLDLQKRRRLY